MTIAPDLIDRVVEENLHDWTFSVERLADLLQISPSYLREHTQRYFGMTPHQLIESRRLQLAVLLLPQHERLYEVSKLIGYNCVRSFRRAFTMRYGMTPSAYREKNPA